VKRRLPAVALGLAVLAIVPATQAASGCNIGVGGQDVTGGGVVDAPAGGDLPYQVIASQPVTHWSIRLRYGGLTVPVLDQDFADGAATRNGTASVGFLARYGTGRYDVLADATLQDARTAPPRSSCASAARHCTASWASPPWPCWAWAAPGSWR